MWIQMEDQICSLEKHWMKNSYNKNFFYWMKKKENKDISYWIQICFDWIKINFDMINKTDIKKIYI